MTTRSFDIAVLAGDGFGPEVTEVAVDVLDPACRRAGGPRLNHQHLDAGSGLYEKTGEAFPRDDHDTAVASSAILIGAFGVPGVAYPDNTEIAPQLDLRFELGLVSGLRPIRSIRGVSGPLRDERAAELDIMIMRESTEGMFASTGKGPREGDDLARDYVEVTRKTSEQLFESTFSRARTRNKVGGPGRVCCVDKANFFTAQAFFRELFDECAANFPDIETDYVYVDAMAQQLVLAP